MGKIRSRAVRLMVNRHSCPHRAGTSRYAPDTQPDRRQRRRPANPEHSHRVEARATRDESCRPRLLQRPHTATGGDDFGNGVVEACEGRRSYHRGGGGGGGGFSLLGEWASTARGGPRRLPGATSPFRRKKPAHAQAHSGPPVSPSYPAGARASHPRRSPADGSKSSTSVNRNVTHPEEQPPQQRHPRESHNRHVLRLHR